MNSSALSLGDRTDTDVTVSDITRLHRDLFTDTDQQFDTGKLRDEQVWIGTGQRTPERVRFVPPPHTEVPPLMSDLATYISDYAAWASPVTKASVVHTQFETIHPFTDGNGRIGRALMHLVLRHEGHRSGQTGVMCTAMMTDLYELTMLDAALQSGVASRRACFEVFARRLPPGRGYGVVAGPGRLAGLLADYRFSAGDLGYLAGLGRFSDVLLEHLAAFRFDGDVWSYREGDFYVPGSPVLRVDASFGAALLVETLVLSVLNHDCAVASAAARMHDAANGRHLIEMGGRRTHELAAVAAARAAWLVGFDATSNLLAGTQFAIPTAGTAAHAFTLAHHDEEAAFEAQIRAHGLETTLLIDTYDLRTGLERALAAAKRLGGVPGAVRIDSGDLAVEVPRVRRWLDDAGAEQTRIVVSGDLDEYRIADLAGLPVDGYGVGTQLVVGSGHATAGMVYKAVAVARHSGMFEPVVPVHKASEGKATRGGVVRPYRVLHDGIAAAEVLSERDRPGPPDSRPLHVPLVRDGQVVYRYDLAADRRFHQRIRHELPASMRSLHGAPQFEAQVAAETAETAETA